MAEETKTKPTTTDRVFMRCQNCGRLVQGITKLCTEFKICRDGIKSRTHLVFECPEKGCDNSWCEWCDPMHLEFKAWLKERSK